MHFRSLFQSEVRLRIVFDCYEVIEVMHRIPNDTSAWHALATYVFACELEEQNHRKNVNPGKTLRPVCEGVPLLEHSPYSSHGDDVSKVQFVSERECWTKFRSVRVLN